MPTDLVRREVSTTREQMVRELTQAESAMKYAQQSAADANVALRDAEKTSQQSMATEKAVRSLCDELEVHLTASVDRPAALERQLEKRSKELEKLTAAARDSKSAVDKARQLFEERDRARIVAEEEFRNTQADLRALDEHIRRLN